MKRILSRLTIAGLALVFAVSLAPQLRAAPQADRIQKKARDLKKDVENPQQGKASKTNAPVNKPKPAPNKPKP
jgi:hypothetical protein